MQNCLHNPEVYDFRQHDQVWQRVQPQMEPFADMQARGTAPAAMQQESNLPGAVQNPCCMGSAAADLLGVLTGYIEEELEDQRTARALAQMAPSWARHVLLEIAADEEKHARHLMAAYYLITGECYRCNVTTGSVRIDQWCAALRNRYHEEACGGLNYARTADDTTDVCLAAMLRAMSADEYRHAEQIMATLERALRCGMK